MLPLTLSTRYKLEEIRAHIKTGCCFIVYKSIALIAVSIPLVPRVGLEPTRTMAYAPKAYVATNYTTEAFAGYRLTCGECSFHLVPSRYYDFFCGESEIRTHGTVASTPPFQGGTFDRSVISPGGGSGIRTPGTLRYA